MCYLSYLLYRLTLYLKLLQRGNLYIIYTVGFHQKKEKPKSDLHRCRKLLPAAALCDGTAF